MSEQITSSSGFKKGGGGKNSFARNNGGGRFGAGRSTGKGSTRSKGGAGKNSAYTKEKGATEEIEDYVFDCSSRKDIELCNKTLDRITTYVGKEYKNGEFFTHILEHLEDPVIQPPERLTEEQKADEFHSYKWKKLMDKYVDKLEVLASGKHKLYSLIWGQCTGLMQTELMAVEGYQTFKSEMDPIALIKAIKGVTYNFRDQKYITGSLWRAYKSLFNTVQREDEDLKKFYDRFKNAVEIIENYGGDIGSMTKLWKLDPDYKQAKEADTQFSLEDLENALFNGIDFFDLSKGEKKLYNTIENNFTAWVAQKETTKLELTDTKKISKNAEKEKLLGFGILANCDKRRYGDLTEDLANQYTFGNDNYPETRQKSYEYAMNYKRFKPKKTPQGNNRAPRDGMSFATTNRGNKFDNRAARGGGCNRPRRCFGDRCYGNCDNPDCTAPGLKNRNTVNTDDSPAQHTKQKMFQPSW